MVGVIADKEEAEVSGVPEFPVAVRTQLLVGESSYAIQAQPTYAAAFSRMEDAVGDVLVQVGGCTFSSTAECCSALCMTG